MGIILKANNAHQANISIVNKSFCYKMAVGGHVYVLANYYFHLRQTVVIAATRYSFHLHYRNTMTLNQLLLSTEYFQ